MPLTLGGKYLSKYFRRGDQESEKLSELRGLSEDASPESPALLWAQEAMGHIHSVWRVRHRGTFLFQFLRPHAQLAGFHHPARG